MARTRIAVMQNDADRSLKVFIPVAIAVTTILGWTSTVSAQDIQLTPAPLVIEDAQYEAPQKLNVTDVSSIIPSPDPIFKLPIAKSPFASRAPMLPSIAAEFPIQENDDQDVQLSSPIQDKVEDRGLLEEDEPKTKPEVDEEDQGEDTDKDSLDDLMSDDDETDEVKTSPNQVWKLKTIGEINFYHHQGGELPADRSAELLASVIGSTHQTSINETVHWVAPNIFYQPLLFEDALLERYGRGSQIWGVQPCKSGVHFAIDSFLMPFRAIKYRCEIETPLAFQRPGSCNEPTSNVFIPKN